MEFPDRIQVQNIAGWYPRSFLGTLSHPVLDTVFFCPSIGLWMVHAFNPNLFTVYIGPPSVIHGGGGGWVAGTKGLSWTALTWLTWKVGRILIDLWNHDLRSEFSLPLHDTRQRKNEPNKWLQNGAQREWTAGSVNFLEQLSCLVLSSGGWVGRFYGCLTLQDPTRGWFPFSILITCKARTLRTLGDGSNSTVIPQF